MRLLLIAVLAGFFLNACKSEDKLLENVNWKLEAATYEKRGSKDVDSTEVFKGLVLTLRDDGKFVWKQDAFTREGTWSKRTIQKMRGVDQSGNSQYRAVSAIYMKWNDTSATEQTLFVDDLNVRNKSMEFSRNYNGNNLEPATERLLFEFNKQ